MVFVPLIILILYLAYTDWQSSVNRNKLKIVIHVNGTRGKTTVVRMLDAVFREHGYKTFSKVTGTEPQYRDINGVVHSIKRNVANIREQRHILNKASKAGAEVLIVECMALQKASQRYSKKLFRSDVSVITNVKTDHMELMGFCKNDMLDHLLEATGDEWIVTSDPYVKMYGSDKKKKMCLAKDERQLTGHIKANTDIVFSVAQYFDLCPEKSKLAIRQYQRDVGYNRIVDYKDRKIYYAFAVNDLESTLSLYDAYLEEIIPMGTLPVLWFNHRKDRPLRAKMFIEWMVCINPQKIILTGDHYIIVKRRLQKSGYKGVITNDAAEIDKNNLVFGFGNMKGLDF